MSCDGCIGRTSSTRSSRFPFQVKFPNGRVTGIMGKTVGEAKESALNLISRSGLNVDEALIDNSAAYSELLGKLGFAVDDGATATAVDAPDAKTPSKKRGRPKKVIAESSTDAVADDPVEALPDSDVTDSDDVAPGDAGYATDGVLHSDAES